MVRQPDVGRCQLGHLAHRGGVGRDVGVDLGVAQLRVGARVEALVLVGDVDGQRAADVRQVGGAADRFAQRFDAQRPVLPAADRIDERQIGRVAVLAEQMDLVAQAGQGRHQGSVVDVAPGPAQQVAVED